MSIERHGIGFAAGFDAGAVPMIRRQMIHQMWVAGCFGMLVLAYLLGPMHKPKL